MSEVKEGYKLTEVGVIPEDWDSVRLSGLTTDIGDGLHGTPVYSLTGQYYFINGNNLKAGAIEITPETKSVDFAEYRKHQKPLSEHTILISINGTVGNLAIYQNEPIILGKSAAYINVISKVSKHFVYFTLQALPVLRQFFGGLTGSTIGNLGLNTIRETYIPLPDFSEQQAIASALSDADALISSLEELLTKKRQLKQAAMQELLTGKTRLEGFDGDWEEKRLGETASLKARIGWQGLTTAEYLESGDYYLVTGTEFQNGAVDWDECHYVTRTRYDQDRNIQLLPGDVLVTKDGTIGKVAYISNLPAPATLNSGVFVIRPLRHSFDSKFFFYHLRSKTFIDFLGQLSAGSTINHLYQKDFVNFKYQMPPTLEEQQAIAAVLSDLDADIASLEERIVKTRGLKQGMMQELLTGRTRLI